MLTTTRENKKATFSRSKRQLSISITNGIDNALLLTNPFKLNLSHDVKTLNVLHLFFKLKLCSEVQDLTFFSFSLQAEQYQKKNRKMLVILILFVIVLVLIIILFGTKF